MHPGPVNRGVELAGRGDRLAAGPDHPAGRGGRGRPHGGALRAAGRPRRRPPSGDASPTRRASPARMNVRRAQLARAAEPAQLLIRGAHVLDPRAGLDGPRDVLVRDGAHRRDRRARHAGGAGRRRGGRRRRGCTLLPGLRRPARAPAHARAGAQGGPRDRHRAPPRPAATAPSSPCRTPTRSWTPRRCSRSLRERARARSARYPSVHRRDHARPARARSSPRWPSCRRRRGRLHRRRAARRRPGMLRQALQYQRLAGGCSRCTRRTRRCRATGRCTRGRSPRCSAWPGSPRSPSPRWSPATARSPLYEGGAHPRPAPVRARVRRGDRAGARRPGAQVTCEATPAPPDVDRRGRADLDTA